MQVIYMMSWS